MQDPRLKPFVVPPPARPYCTFGSLVACPAVWLGCLILGPMLQSLLEKPRPRAYGQPVTIICYFGPNPDDYKLALAAFCGALLGLILLWFAVERNEYWKPARKPAFVINSLIILLMAVHIFVQPIPLFF